ncbi:FKBP-type peptidyl-prolyl cis-trans isomerase [Echinimonas agarilytica]|uniref:Peptidyl-prolyl cis-trans isomerase n=1 Tax=Echinimonas agarilytica TaxID=1215918 RepID=A0AA42B808_9GAMM|nr:peptidylprolyl isomerase [Echinimonas agarilytica]MCM2680334.1 peptidylprolyl isomerase [Echinimonas agarilytica]
MKVAKDNVVILHYSVHSQETLLDSSLDGEPLNIIQGHGQLIPGLEAALDGKAKGDTFTVEIEADQAYGQRHETLMQAVSKEMFEGMDVQAGMQFRATTEAGDQSVIVLDVTDDEVIVDGNHPLAGMDLTFDVEVVDVREATAEELAHGHVHSAGGCGHNH